MLTKPPGMDSKYCCKQAKLSQNFFDSSRCDVTCITVLRILSCIACLTLQDQTLQCIFMLPSVDPSIDPVSRTRFLVIILFCSCCHCVYLCYVTMLFSVHNVLSVYVHLCVYTLYVSVAVIECYRKRKFVNLIDLE